MNEIIFILQILVLSTFLLISLKFGKTSLFIFTCLQPIFCNLFVLKQITLFKLQITSAEAYAVIGVLGMNLLREYYGVKEARKAIYFSFMSMALFTLMTQFQIIYHANSWDWCSANYDALFRATPRIVLFSFISFFLSERLDLFIFSYLKRKVAWGKISFRYTLSTLISQLFDTLFLTFFAFYGILDNLLDLVMFSYSIKVVAIFSTSGVAYISKLFVPKVSKEAL